MNFLRIYRYGLLVGIRDYGRFWTWRTWFCGWMLRIITNALIWIYMGRLLHSPDTMHFLLIGNAATAGFGTYSVAAAAWDRYDGTYPLMVVAPGPTAAAILGRTSIWGYGWIASAALTFIILLPAFGVRASWAVLAVAPLLIALMSISTFLFSSFLGAFANWAPKVRSIIGWALIYGIVTFCGVSVPVQFWPSAVQLAVSFLPVTHGLQALRLLLAQGPASQILFQAGLEAAVGLGWLLLAILTFDRFADAGRASGSIELT